MLIKYFKYICISLAILGTLFVPYILARNFGQYIGTKYSEWRYRPETIPYRQGAKIKTEPTPQEVANYYLNASRRAGWTIHEITKGYNVLYCESKFVFNAKNNNSTAVGVAQWLNGTWAEVAPINGDRLDYKLSIDLFIKHFPTTPKWWKKCL